MMYDINGLLPPAPIRPEKQDMATKAIYEDQTRKFIEAMPELVIGLNKTINLIPPIDS